ELLPGRFLPVVILPEDDHRCSLGDDPPMVGGKSPLVGPGINPGGVIGEQPDAGVTGRVSGQVIFVNGDARRVVEVDVPAQKPLLIDSAASRLRSPICVIESGRRWRRLLSRAGGPPPHEPPEFVGAEGLDAARNYK